MMENLSKLEWEFIQKDIELINDYEISSNIGLNDINSCIIKRNEKYELILEIQGHSAVDADELNVKYEIIYFIFENDNEKITASFCVFNKQHISMDVNGLHQYLQFKVNNIERQYKNKDFKSLNKVKEWYLWTCRIINVRSKNSLF